MKRTKQIIILLWLIIIGLNGLAQKHYWVQPIDGTTHALVNAVSLDSNHNSYIVGFFRDTLKIDKKTFVAKTRDATFIAKFNQNGQFAWCKPIYSIGSNTFYLNNIRVLSNNRIIIYGSFFSSKLMLSPTDSIINAKTGNSLGFIAIYDSIGRVTEHHKVFEGSGGVMIMNGQIDIDLQNNIYLNFSLGNGVIYSKTDSSKVNSTSGALSRIVKYSSFFDSILWHKDLSTGNANNFFALKIRIGKDNNLYIASILKGGIQTINKISYALPSNFCKGFLIILSSKGKFIHTGYINSDINQQDNLFDIAANDTNRIYVYGYVKDSILRGGKWYKSLNPGSVGNAFPYIGLISTSKVTKWINFTRNKDNMGTSSSYFSIGYLGRLNFDKSGNVYSSFQQNGSSLISIGGLSDTNRYNFGFAKFDSLGNALWLRGAAYITDMQPADKNIIYGGGYDRTLKLPPFTIKAPYSYSGFIARTQDYAINRGKVYAGPYCAGDSIKIPYDKNGDFDTSNLFIGEISDEFGNFEGKERELGRIKTNKDSVVIGKLPMFQTASSGKYRIRIRSTSPVVQSFYQYDILRLLIYSRDSANPGPTETICLGDSVKLSTFGGTKWTWSPKYNISDSTLRQPIAWPQTTTVYKIIIGDSSGCGAPDTAFKKIIVRKALKATLAFNDTAVCDGSQIKIPVKFEGGDSINYRWQWFSVDKYNSWTYLSSGKIRNEDTLVYSPKVSINDTLKVALILTDGCTPKSDISFLTISQRKSTFILTKFKDTTVCNGTKLIWKAKAVGSTSGIYQWKWLDLTNNKILSTTESMNFTAEKTTRIKLTVNDGCATLGDYSLFTVSVKPPLKATTNLSDITLCFGQNINLTVAGDGGNIGTYAFSWVLGNKVISSSDNLLLKTEDYFSNSAQTSPLTLILKDNCTIPNDTIKKTIIIKPNPIANFSWDLACSRTITKFQFTGTKPQSPTTTQFTWNFNNESPSYLENPSYLFTLAGTKKIRLIVASNNGCNDTMVKDVVIKTQSKADFTATDVCETDSAVFINKSQDANGYNWKFGDGQNSKVQNPKHKFQILSTTTYNVTLVAQVNNGCADSISKAVTINQNPSSDFSYVYNGTKVDLKIIKSGNSYQWKFGTTDSIKTTATTYTQIIKSSDQTNVCLIATDISGCSSQTCKNVSVGILSILKTNGFKLYPNPNTGNFTIEIDNPSKDMSIAVYDLTGKLIKTVETSPTKISYLIDLNVANGIYLVKVKNGEAVFNQKIVVSK